MYIEYIKDHLGPSLNRIKKHDKMVIYDIVNPYLKEKVKHINNFQIKLDFELHIIRSGVPLG